MQLVAGSMKLIRYELPFDFTFSAIPFKLATISSLGNWAAGDVVILHSSSWSLDGIEFSNNLNILSSGHDTPQSGINIGSGVAVEFL